MLLHNYIKNAYVKNPNGLYDLIDWEVTTSLIDAQHFYFTGVIQMMLPAVLSSEYCVYHHMQTDYMVDSRKYDTIDFAVVRDMIRPSIYSDDSKLLHAMVNKVLGRQHR